MKNIEKAFNSITSSDYTRGWMSKPFTIEKYVYATDAHIIARIPIEKISPKEKLELKRESSVLNIFNYSFKKELSIDLKKIKQVVSDIPLVDEYKDTDSDGCCITCEGDGDVVWEYEGYSKYDDCPKCHGSGFIKIESREKTGKKISDTSFYIQILNSLFSLEKIKTLIAFTELIGAKKIDVINQRESFSVTLFKIGITEVGLMPVTKNPNQKIAYHFH